MRTQPVTGFLFIALAVSTSWGQPLGTAFTYQGRLENAGQPASGLHDLQFRLFDAATGGNQVGPLLCIDNQDIVEGLFSASLDFGAAFAGAARFLQVAVRADTTGGNCDVGSYTTLSPRQSLSAAPNAAFALNAGLLDGLDSAAFLQAIPTPLTLSGTSTTQIIRGENSSTASSSSGLFGLSTAASGNTRGVRGQSASTNGTGVFGEATATTGLTFGVYGRTSSVGLTPTIGSFGIIGEATGLTGPTAGVWGSCDSTEGHGVRGEATATTGMTYGGYFESASSFGRGVHGSGRAYGGIFVASNTGGSGVGGFAVAVTGFNQGVYGESDSTSGTGVSGLATASTGETIGVLGQADSNSGTGVYGLCSAGGVAVRGDVLFTDATGGVFSNILQPERTVELAGPDGAINTAGFLNREYTANTPRCAIPIAYGSIGTTGTINGGTGNFTVSHTVTGEYDITINGEPYSNLTFVVTITPITNSPRVTGVADAGAAFRVNMWNMSSTLVDDDFQFTVWTANPN